MKRYHSTLPHTEKVAKLREILSIAVFSIEAQNGFLLLLLLLKLLVASSVQCRGVLLKYFPNQKSLKTSTCLITSCSSLNINCRPFLYSGSLITKLYINDNSKPHISFVRCVVNCVTLPCTESEIV